MFVAYEGDSLKYHLGQMFSTHDQDFTHEKCAGIFKAAWWYKKCHHSNLNGHYLKGPHKSYANGVSWLHWKGHQYSMRFTEMKIRAY